MLDKVRQEHIILGVDPGTLFMGYAILKTFGQQVDILEFGAYDVHKLEGQYPRLQKEFFFLQEIRILRVFRRSEEWTALRIFI
jgi:Holliday junction resolvasome RuvABC endonuclease subunit